MKTIVKYISIIILLIIYSCQSDDITEAYRQGTNEYTNQWIYEQMKRYYYWNETLPGKGDLSLPSKEYFKYLLNTSDRFSYAMKPSDVATYPKSVRNSFGFDVAFIEHNGNTYGVILYVLRDSPAYYAGLERGNLITAINTTDITNTNYQQLYDNILQTQSANLKVVTYTEDSGFSAPRQVTLNNGIILLQPINSSVIHYEGRKVGYIEIPHFDIGLSQILQNAFMEFKNKGVNEVVVDLRYNGGGDVSSATALCTLLAPNIQTNDLFIRFKGNGNGGQTKQTFLEALEMNEQQVSFNALRNAHPDIRRVFVLCGAHTGSASEVVINNLKPFMEVVTIGDKTLGKDVATFPITDDRDTPGEDKWELYPAIYKLSNANGEGNYGSGLQPSITVDELSDLNVHPLGEQNEILLNHALNMITGSGRISGKKSCRTLLQKNDASGENILVFFTEKKVR